MSRAGALETAEAPLWSSTGLDVSRVALPRWLWVALAALTLLAFGFILRGYLLWEGFYFLPRYVEVPFSDTLRAKWLLKASPDDPEAGFKFYRPLAYMWFHAKVLLWRGWLPGLRVDHLLLNVVFSLSVGRLAIWWTRDRTVGTVAALLAVAGPGHMRFMPTIYGSGVLLHSLASLWAVIWTHRAVADQRNRTVVAAMLAATAGLLLYEQVAVIPLLGVATAFLVEGPPLRRYRILLLAALTLTIAFFAFRFAMFGGLGGYESPAGASWFALDSLWALTAQFFRAEYAAFASLAWPWHPPIADPSPWVDAVVLTVWAAAGVLAWRRAPGVRRAILCGLLWIATTSVPVMSTLRSPTAWGHAVFLGSAGSAILGGAILCPLLRPPTRNAIAGLWIGTCVVATWKGMGLWRHAWSVARNFRTQLEAQVPRSLTPAFAYIDGIPDSGISGIPVFLAPQDHDAYTGYLRTRLFMRVFPVRWPPEKPYRGDRTWPPPEELHLHWLHWDADTQSLTRIRNMPQPVPGEPGSWEFSHPAEAREWRPAFHLARVSGSQPPMFVSEGEFPLFLGPRLPADAGTPVLAEVTMAIRAGDVSRGIAEWQFRTAKDPEPSPAHVVRFWVIQDGALRTYRVPLVNNPNLLLDGPPTQVDFRPTNTPGAVVLLHRIRLLPRREPEA